MRAGRGLGLLVACLAAGVAELTAGAPGLAAGSESKPIVVCSRPGCSGQPVTVTPDLLGLHGVDPNTGVVTLTLDPGSGGEDFADHTFTDTMQASADETVVETTTVKVEHLPRPQPALPAPSA